MPVTVRRKQLKANLFLYHDSPTPTLQQCIHLTQPQPQPLLPLLQCPPVPPLAMHMHSSTAALHNAVTAVGEGAILLRAHSSKLESSEVCPPFQRFIRRRIHFCNFFKSVIIRHCYCAIGHTRIFFTHCTTHKHYTILHIVGLLVTGSWRSGEMLQSRCICIWELKGSTWRTYQIVFSDTTSQ